MNKLKLQTFLTSIAFLLITQVTLLIAEQTLSNALTNTYKNTPVLVTGGCGFIGSHLVEKLISLGAEVSILDDLSSGNKENISTVIDKVTYMHGSITDFDTCLRATQNKKIIFHLAAFVSVPASIEQPQICHDINITGTQNILEAARINNVKRIVFSSSCAVYGEPTSICHETTPQTPTSPYGFSKLIGELYCKEYAQIFDMETVAMRYFNVYGDRQDSKSYYAGVVAKFNYNMEHNLPLIIFGDGTQTRDFVSVETVVDANIMLGYCNKKHIQGEIFNIATGTSITIYQLIDKLKQNYPSYSQMTQLMPARPGDVMHVSADCSKYNNLYASITQ